MPARRAQPSKAASTDQARPHSPAPAAAAPAHEDQQPSHLLQASEPSPSLWLASLPLDIIEEIGEPLQLADRCRLVLMHAWAQRNATRMRARLAHRHVAANPASAAAAPAGCG